MSTAPANADYVELVMLLHRYADCIDAADVDGVVMCFTPDADVQLSAGLHRMTGHDELRAHWRPRLRPETSTHLVSNVIIEVDGGGAASVMSQAVAFLRRDPVVVVRGLRYHDECVRTTGGWRIRSRRHWATWQGEANAVPVASPASASRGTNERSD